MREWWWPVVVMWLLLLLVVVVGPYQHIHTHALSRQRVFRLTACVLGLLGVSVWVGEGGGGAVYTSITRGEVLAGDCLGYKL